MKEKFLRYEEVRLSGKYNMIMEWVDACIEADLNKEDYFYIIEHYSKLKEKYKNELRRD